MKYANAIRYLLLLLALLSMLFAVACDTPGDDATQAESETDAQTEAPVCEHLRSEWRTTVEATCKNGGEEKKFCLACQKELESKNTPALPHTEAIVPSVSATCTAEGLSAGKICSVCQTVLLEQKPIAKLPHSEELIAGTPPTCLEAGLTDGKKCAACGEITLAQAEIAKLPHTEAVLPGKAPTCTATGLSDARICTVCESVLVPQTTLAIIAHTESGWIVDAAATTEAPGKKHTECTQCGSLISEVEIPKLDESHVHVGSIWTVTTPATCKQTGVESHLCECGITLETRETALAAHTEETVHGTAPTCKEPGLSDGKKCSVCGKVTKEQTTIPVIAHTETSLPAIAPTCRETGLTEGKKCAVCGEVIVAQEPVATVPHTEELVPGKAPSCKEKGLTDGKKCAVCGEVLIPQRELALVGHTPTAVHGTPPTCDESGLTDGTSCAICFIPLTTQVVLPPTGHTFVGTSCKICGDPAVQSVWIVDGLGNPVESIYVTVMKGEEKVKTLPYDGEFLPLPGLDENETYTLSLDLSSLKGTYVYDEATAVISPDAPSATVRIFRVPALESDPLYVAAPIDKEHRMYSITSEGSYKLTLAQNDYTFFIFTPTKAAIYTVTYECTEALSIGYHGSSFFVQGYDMVEFSNGFSTYGNGISFNVYTTDLGGDRVFGIKSNGATECVINIKNAGDPGTRLEDQPWTPYLEDEDVVAAGLAAAPAGTYTPFNIVSDLTLTAHYNEADGYYHSGSVDGPVIYIDLTTASPYIASIQTICANQRMGTYVYDERGNLLEKRSFNELFIQYGMPSDATPVDVPIRIPLTEKLATAIKSYGNSAGWWNPESSLNLFTGGIPGAIYNEEYAWLLFCGIFQ